MDNGTLIIMCIVVAACAGVFLFKRRCLKKDRELQAQLKLHANLQAAFQKYAQAIEEDMIDKGLVKPTAKGALRIIPEVMEDYMDVTVFVDPKVRE